MDTRELHQLRIQSGIKNLLTQNTKMVKTSKANNKRVFNFNLPAHKSMQGETICPFAGICVNYCYAQKGHYVISPTMLKSEFKYQYSKNQPELFFNEIMREIRKKRVDYLRVHDSGDYYSLDYMKLWFRIAINNPRVTFYSYTKSHQMVRLAKRLNLIPKNYRFIFSMGSIQDNLIDTDTEVHARIFKTESELVESGYVNASHDDLIALSSIKVGLVIH